MKPLVMQLNTRGTRAAEKNWKIFLHQSFSENRFHAPLWFQWKGVTHEHHVLKFYNACHARYLVANCLVFQSGSHLVCSTKCLQCFLHLDDDWFGTLGIQSVEMLPSNFFVRQKWYVGILGKTCFSCKTKEHQQQREHQITKMHKQKKTKS